jgi:AcrR family transcriptional regulator
VVAPGTVPAMVSGRRQQHKDDTRAALEQAAFALFEERGFDDTTVDDIARAADVSPRTFFRYFRAKDDVVFTDHPERIERLRQALADRPDDEPVVASVREAILTLADDIDLHRERAHLQAKVASESGLLAARALELQQEFTALFTDHVAERTGLDPDRDIRPNLVGATVVAALSAAVGTWMAGDGERELTDLVREALELLDQGLGLQP